MLANRTWAQEKGEVGFMIRYLQDHIEYLSKIDLQFREEQRNFRTNLLLLQQLELHRAMLDGAFPRRQTEADVAARALFENFDEVDFPVVSASDRIAHVLDAAALQGVYCLAFQRLVGFVQGSPASSQLYGSIKSREGILERIRSCRDAGGVPDVWDAVRFRVIVPGLSDLACIWTRLLDEFGDSVVRRRNYYLRPRKGPDDPYRALHFELYFGAGRFVELQALTRLREAVGAVDHLLVCKRSSSFIHPKHECWLKELSWTGNIVDAECVRRGSQLSHDIQSGCDWAPTADFRSEQLQARPPSGRVLYS
jgi:hypothetical protein